MANQRSKDKKVISVPLPKELLERIEKEAARTGKNRVDLINEVLRSPKRWNAAALKQSAAVALAKLQHLAK